MINERTGPAAVHDTYRLTTGQKARNGLLFLRAVVSDLEWPSAGAQIVSVTIGGKIAYLKDAGTAEPASAAIDRYLDEEDRRWQVEFVYRDVKCICVGKCDSNTVRLVYPKDCSIDYGQLLDKIEMRFLTLYIRELNGIA